MAIPTIKPYPMPGEGELPKNRVAWQPDAGRCALLIHDAQRYFLNAFAAGASPLTELLDRTALVRRRCWDLRVPVFYSVQPGAQSAAERGLLEAFWGAG